MKTSVRAVIFLLLASPLAWGDSASRYVNASRLPLRASASSTANAVGYVTTSQSVRLIASQGEWCEVEGGTPAAHGYCLCKYLAATPLSMAEITKQLAKPKLPPREQLDWESRAFWVQPSLQRWVDIGKSLEKVHLSPETLNKEIAQTKPLRFKVPEFEAMKRRLEQGIVSPPLASLTFNASDIYDGYLAQALKRASLPRIKPSYFTDDAVFALPGQPFNLEMAQFNGIALVDALSGFHKTPFRVHFNRPAYYAGLNLPRGQTGFIKTAGPLDIIAGTWDVGALTANFDTPARLNGITLRGRATAIDVAAVGVDFNSGSCIGNGLTLDTRPVKQMPPWQDTLVAWVGKPALPRVATVKTRRLNGKDQYNRLEIHDIDLNGDGVVDFSVWNGRYEPQISADGLWQAVFANVDGKWRLMAYEQDADCT